MKKIKVMPWNKALWSKYFFILSVISTITSLIFLFWDVPDKDEKKWLGALIFLLVAAFLVLWTYTNKLRKISLTINNSVIEIEEGDIFTSEGYCIIAFNEYFDTIVDNIIISENSINGKYIKKFYSSSVVELDNIIESDPHATDCIIGKNLDRRQGRQTQYKLGTIIKNDKFFLLAFSRFDQNNRAYLEMDDCTACLMNMWNECDIHYGGQSVTLPLLGAGITRFRGYENITDQELLEIILWTFKVSRIRFQSPAKVKIVLTKNSVDKINLFEIKNRFKS